MRSKTHIATTVAVVLGTALAAPHAGAEILTVDRAVQLALKQGSQAIQSEAGVLDAKGGVWSAYSGVLPHVSAAASRGLGITNYKPGEQVFGAFAIPQPARRESYSTTPSISGSWSFLNLSSLSNLSAARSGLKSSELQRTAARQEIAFNARRQFYEVVKAIKLAEVSDGALRVSRDNERRVHALFEVGSVSRSDVLKSQVQTSRSELDSLQQHHAITIQRIALATLLGVPEGGLDAVDTVLTAEARDYDEASMLQEASRNRPDLMAAEAELSAAHASLRASRWARLPYLTASASYDYRPKSETKTTVNDSTGARSSFSSRSESDFQFGGSVAINLDLFNGFATDARIASSRARLMRAQDARDALRRNLAADVHQSLLTYREVIAGRELASRGLDSATESLKLTQQKYNVGSATILELVDAQVQLQRAQSDVVSSTAAIRVSEAQLNRVLGRGE